MAFNAGHYLKYEFFLLDKLYVSRLLRKRMAELTFYSNNHKYVRLKKQTDRHHFLFGGQDSVYQVKVKQFV